MRKVLVTGSRDLTKQNVVWNELENELHENGPFFLVVGDADGADAAAVHWAKATNTPYKRFEANWGRPCTEYCYHKPRWKNGRRYCPVAGNLRNQEMVDYMSETLTDEDRCLGFPWGKSTGTRDCMKRAKKAGIPMKVFEQ